MVDFVIGSFTNKECRSMCVSKTDDVSFFQKKISVGDILMFWYAGRYYTDSDARAKIKNGDNIIYCEIIIGEVSAKQNGSFKLVNPYSNYNKTTNKMNNIQLTNMSDEKDYYYNRILIDGDYCVFLKKQDSAATDAIMLFGPENDITPTSFKFKDDTVDVDVNIQEALLNYDSKIKKPNDAQVNGTESGEVNTVENSAEIEELSNHLKDKKISNVLTAYMKANIDTFEFDFKLVPDSSNKSNKNKDYVCDKNEIQTIDKPEETYYTSLINKAKEYTTKYKKCNELLKKFKNILIGNKEENYIKYLKDPTNTLYTDSTSTLYTSNLPNKGGFTEDETNKKFNINQAVSLYRLFLIYSKTKYYNSTTQTEPQTETLPFTYNDDNLGDGDIDEFLKIIKQSINDANNVETNIPTLILNNIRFLKKEGKPSLFGNTTADITFTLIDGKFKNDSDIVKNASKGDTNNPVAYVPAFIKNPAKFNPDGKPNDKNDTSKYIKTYYMNKYYTEDYVLTVHKINIGTFYNNRDLDKAIKDWDDTADLFSSKRIIYTPQKLKDKDKGLLYSKKIYTTTGGKKTRRRNRRNANKKTRKY